MKEERVALEDKVRRLEEGRRRLEETVARSERLHEDELTGPGSNLLGDEGEAPLRVEAGPSRKRPASSREGLDDDEDDDNSEIHHDRNLELNRHGKTCPFQLCDRY